MTLVDGGFTEEADGAEVREGKKDEGGKRELDEHVQAGGEEGEVEVEVLRGEHPFVIDGDQEGEEVPVRKGGGCVSWVFFMGSRMYLGGGGAFHSFPKL